MIVLFFNFLAWPKSLRKKGPPGPKMKI